MDKQNPDTRIAAQTLNQKVISIKLTAIDEYYNTMKMIIPRGQISYPKYVLV